MNFAAGGVATPADAALMMELGAEGVFVGSGIFKSGDPEKCAAAIVQAVANWQDSKLLAKPRCERLARGSWKSITACERLARDIRKSIAACERLARDIRKSITACERLARGVGSRLPLASGSRGELHFNCCLRALGAKKKFLIKYEK